MARVAKQRVRAAVCPCGACGKEYRSVDGAMEPMCECDPAIGRRVICERCGNCRTLHCDCPGGPADPWRQP